MRPVQPYRRRSLATLWLGLLLVLLVGSGSVVGLLALLGVSLNPFATTRDNPYLVRIPVNSKAIPAYERVQREHLLNPETGELTFQPIPPAATVGMSIAGVASDGSHVESRVETVRNDRSRVVFVASDGSEIAQERVIELGGALMQVSAIIGRVVKKDKRAGLGFREETFFPQGTPEGIAGATPKGMRTVTLDATSLTGVHSLNAGDRIDLMASVPVSEIGAFGAEMQDRVSAAAIVASSAPKDSPAATEPVMLAQNAVVLKPVYVRNETIKSSSLTQGTRLQNLPKYEVAIAVAPEDVIPVQSALDKSLKITCVVHSMKVVDADSSAASDLASSDEFLSVPVTVRAILAYGVVSRDVFVSPATRRVRTSVVSRREIDRLGIITSLDEAIGAIARHDIPAGRFLRKSDLLATALPEGSTSSLERGRSVREGRQSQSSVPVQYASMQHSHNHQHAGPSSSETNVVGDRPAITRFVPPGRTAFAVPWNRLYGAEHLQIGDEIDLLASYSLQSEREEEETETRPDGTKIVRKRNVVAARETLRTWDETFGNRAEPWFVASGALVVGPVGFPAPAPAQRALSGAQQPSSATGEGNALTGPALIIAVDQRDVESVATALATKDALFTPAFHPSGRDATPPDGTKRIAVAAQDVEAYLQLKDTIWNGNRRRPMSRLVSVDDPSFSNALSLDELKGFEFRVLRRMKRRGDFFTPDDFLPEGAGPGVAAAAGPDSTVFAVADNEIEGLDTFQAEDRVAILERGVVSPVEGVVVHGVDLERPVSRVVAPSARIVRASRAGQTILEVDNEHLTQLQAAWAASMHANEQEGGGQRRSHLLAVGLPRPRGQAPAGDNLPIALVRSKTNSRTEASQNPQASPSGNGIPAFDRLGNVQVIETLVGGKREYHAFSAGGRSDVEPEDEDNSQRVGP